jgi:ClpP class serine protease
MTELHQQIWACEEAALVDYLSRREHFELTGIDPKHEAFLFGAGRDRAPILSISNGVATIAIEGVLSKAGPDLIDQLLGFGGTGYGEIESALTEALESPAVQSIRLAIDSPGGEVFGVDEARGAIARAASSKPVTAFNTGRVASAAYWLASSAQKIVATSPANLTGSIGVVAVAIDRSDRDRKFGVVTVVSRNAPDKRPDLSTEAGRSIVQDQVDALERAFIERVAEGRGIEADTVKATFGRGRMLVAIDPDKSKPSALSVGMIDEVIDGFGKSSSTTQAGPAAVDDQAIDEAGHTATADQDAPHCAAGMENDMSKELEARIAELETMLGQTAAAQTDLRARMEAVAPILASNVYPAVIKEVAARVLSGKEHAKALEGAVAVFDAQHATATIEAAKLSSSEAKGPEPRALESATPADGSIVSAASLESAVGVLRAQLGRE